MLTPGLAWADDGTAALAQVIRYCDVQTKANPYADGFLSRTIVNDCCMKKMLGMGVDAKICAKYGVN
jgi:hypothetical protein